MDDQPTTVGWVGLGTMGFPMARNLITKVPTGSRIFVYDVSQAAVDSFVKQHPKGAVACSSAKEVAEHAVSRGRSSISVTNVVC